MSLAHNGVLFLDEFPEFPRNVLEILRQPLEDSTVTIARSNMTLCFPASFMLVAAMNPCPCGFYGDPTRECRCTPAHHPALSGQDQRTAARPHRYTDRSAGGAVQGAAPAKCAESSEDMRARAERAREVQHGARLQQFADARRDRFASMCALDETGERTLEMAMRRMSLSARAHDRILKVARTVADLEGSDACARSISPRRFSIGVWTGITGIRRILLKSSD